MEYFPRLRRELRVAENPEKLSAFLVTELPQRGVFIQQHYPGLRVIGTAFRRLSLSWGQEIRIELRPIDTGHTEAIIESRFQFPWMDFSHENEKNLDMVEDLLDSAGAGIEAAISPPPRPRSSKPAPEARA